MKHPNGYGSVVKLSGNRRNPFAVRKTIGWNEKGHPKYQFIGYYPTREEALIALAEFNKTPWDIDAGKVTFTSLYEDWIEKKLSKMSISSQRTLKSAYKHTEPLWKMKYKDIKSFHMQDVIDNCGYGYSTQWAIKNLFNHLDKFALEMDVINKGYAQLTTAEQIPDSTKQPFTDEEVKRLWEQEDYPGVDTVLIFLYTGFRISELLGIRSENVDLQEGTIKGGTKTKAGKDRIVPIHSKIRHLIENRLQSGDEYLITKDHKKMITQTYYKDWDRVMGRLDMKHTPHECRHTLRSRLDSAGANKRCIDLIMGHKSKEVGERVYTHKTLDELKEAIEMIKD